MSKRVQSTRAPDARTIIQRQQEAFGKRVRQLVLAGTCLRLIAEPRKGEPPFRNREVSAELGQQRS